MHQCSFLRFRNEQLTVLDLGHGYGPFWALILADSAAFAMHPVHLVYSSIVDGAETTQFLAEPASPALGCIYYGGFQTMERFSADHLGLEQQLQVGSVNITVCQDLGTLVEVGQGSGYHGLACSSFAAYNGQLDHCTASLSAKV
jgi:hypothetical protein